MVIFDREGSNIVSEPLRFRPNPGVISKLQQHHGEVVTATVVFHELLFGCYRLPVESNKRKIIQVYAQHGFLALWGISIHEY